MTIKKADIDNRKSGHSHKQLNIDDEKIKNFSNRTLDHIDELFTTFGYESVFGRMLVEEILKLKKSGASTLITKLLKADIIEPVVGHGKGKYKFKKNNE